MTARSVADLLGIQLNSAALLCRKIRKKIGVVIAYYLDLQAHEIFGMLKRSGKTYIKILANTKAETKMLLTISVVYRHCYISYNVLDVSDFYHERIYHSKLFGIGHNHINGIKNFWNQANRILKKYNEILKDAFPQFLKECEFRFNYGIPKQQFTKLKNLTGL